MKPLLIVFETHATTVDNEQERATGWLPGELSAAGREQAAALGMRIREHAPDAVIASDLDRARQTVEIACAGLEVPIFYDWRLRECHYGLLNGAPKAQVHGAGLDRFLRNPYPAGESWLGALARVDRSLDDLRQLWPGGRIVVVGHIATRWALRRRTESITLDELAGQPFRWQPGWEFLLN
ncbi:histidine phosphatase family protein [Microlunatus speluncae]|uniref:histidine phosphatase family protein n=1 Tax=Microlunatus speluncae TaxID=2594267 RepID=UPI0012663A9A|nr:histidine phosphatase family protein [Microlunatus speluncae]